MVDCCETRPSKARWWEAMGDRIARRAGHPYAEKKATTLACARAMAAAAPVLPGLVGLGYLALSAVALAASACGGEPVRAPAPVDKAWSETPLTPEWSFLARGVAGDRAAECRAVDQALGRERTCVASLCEHAVPLAKEWLLRCRTVAADRVSDVEVLAQTFEDRTHEPTTECGRRATSILRDQCSAAGACRPLVERWAASCAGSEGTPLVMRKLERAVVLAEGKEGFDLDTRSCGELFSDVVRGARCESRRQCEEDLPAVEAFRSRCMVAGEPVSWPTALSLVSVLSGAGLRVAPLLLSPTDAQRGPEGPLVLGDGDAVLLRVCGEPVSSGKQVVAARRDCRGGELLFARSFDEPGGPVVRVGALFFDEDQAFDRRFPRLHVNAEADVLAEEALVPLEKDLDRAAALARSGSAPEAWRILAAALFRHLDILDHPRVAAALTRRDEVLAPALRELGRAKVTAARQAKSADLAPFAQRASARVLADVSPDGAVEIGERRAIHAELSASLPRGVAAYRDAVADVARVLVVKNVRPVDAAAAGQAARAEIGRCAEAVKDAALAEGLVLRCSFAVETCEAEKMTARGRALDAARRAQRTLLESVELLVASAPDASGLAAAQRSAGCVRD